MCLVFGPLAFGAVSRSLLSCKIRFRQLLATDSNNATQQRWHVHATLDASSSFNSRLAGLISSEWRAAASMRPSASRGCGTRLVFGAEFNFSVRASSFRYSYCSVRSVVTMHFVAPFLPSRSKFFYEVMLHEHFNSWSLNDSSCESFQIL